MREGSLDAPTRHPIDWQSPDFTDPDKLDAEMRRIFDVCHGCRRCFNLCDSFPKLFDLIDESSTGEVDGVSSADFDKVVSACTLCDMCFMTKCPYVPPHDLNIDFPHLMLRYRVAERQQGHYSRVQDELVKTDRNGKILSAVAPLVNWGGKTSNVLTRPIMEKTLGIHQNAAIPKFSGTSFIKQSKTCDVPVNQQAPAYGRKAIIFATCFCNYNNPAIGMAVQKVLRHNGVETKVLYPGCCGMPSLEGGDLEKVAETAKRTAEMFVPFIEDGYAIIAPIPSCALMIKKEWPLIMNQDPSIEKLAEATQDIAQYIVDIAKTEGLVNGLSSLKDKPISLHIACHARAQNIGRKSAEMLLLIPETTVHVVERCSGHGGTWGMMLDHFEIALKVGKPVAQEMLKKQNPIVSSECPLAATHIQQGMEKLESSESLNIALMHPIEIMAMAYNL